MPYESLKPFRKKPGSGRAKKAPQRVLRRIHQRASTDGESETSPKIARAGRQIKWFSARS